MRHSILLLFLFYTTSVFSQFEDAEALISNFSNLHSVTSKDVDGDGDVDLLLARSFGFYYYENDGTGSFGPAVEIGDEMRRINDTEIADLDGDGDLDIAYVSGTFQKSIGYFENDGSGNYTMRVFDIASGDLGRPYDLELADLDNDGDMDYITTNYDKQQIRLSYNLGNGEFGDYQLLDSHVWVLTTVAHDHDDDGFPEIYYLSFTGNALVAIGYYKRNSTGGYSDTDIDGLRGNNSNLFKLVDMDMDGDLDAIGGHYNSYQIEWVENTGNGVFGGMQTIWEDSEFDLDSKITNIHLDRKGDQNLIYAWSEEGSMYRIEQIPGTTDFLDPQLVYEGPHGFPNEEIKQFSDADFNQDGLVDIVYISGDILWIRFASEFEIDNDNDGYNEDVDCDDNNVDVNPGQVEIPYNGLDDDCNPVTLDDDLDQDGFILDEDCDDENSEINPDAMEIPGNQIDEDCDGMDGPSATHELNGTVIKVFPNPSSDIVRIECSSNIDYNLEVYSSQAQKLLFGNNLKTLDLSDLPDGHYYIRLFNSDGSINVIDRIVLSRH